MKLALFRHGLAMDRDEAHLKKILDGQRPLVEKGKERTRKMAKHLRDHGENYEVLIYSPLLRSRQTAEIVKEFFSIKKVFEVAEIIPDAPPEAFAKWISSTIPQMTSALVIGHEPQLSQFASWCLGSSDDSFIQLKKSGVIGLELESFSEVFQGSAQLTWLLQPKVI